LGDRCGRPGPEFSRDRTPWVPRALAERENVVGARRALVLLFFLVSGASALVLEVTWTRVLGRVFGNTVYAASAVLTAYMLGLAAGSAVLGRVADRWARPLVLYGLLELGVGAYALAFPLLVAATDWLYGAFYRGVSPGFGFLSGVRLGLSLALLVAPTFLMGGTLPALARQVGWRGGEPSRQVGYLYGVNTAGAVAGCFLSGFVLLEAIGVRGSLAAAGVAALAVGAAAVVFGRRWAPETTAPRGGDRQAESAGGGGGEALVLTAYAVAGFCALASEVLWTRVLVFVLATSVYSFATMLTTFLCGLALGSVFSARVLAPRVRRPVRWLGGWEVGVGLVVLASVPLLARLERVDYGLSRLLVGGARWQVVAARFADAFVVLFLPAFLMGGAFPLAVRCVLRGGREVGRRLGRLYAANTAGCLLGSFSAGFVLLPLLGTHRSILAVVLLNVGVGSALLWRAGGRLAGRLALAAPALGAAAVALALTPGDIFYETINAYHYPSKIVYLREHTTGTVTVHDLPNGNRLLAVDGVDVAGLDFMLRSTQKLQGYIPLLVHRRPRRVVQIGFGSGETARVGLMLGVEDYTVVEICPAVFEAGDFFTKINGGSHRDGRIRRVIMDGKNFARLTAERFDVIMNDSTYPGSSGSSALYTLDHFLACRRKLNPGGVFSCWVPLDLRPREMRMIIRSFQEAFPHSSLWLATNCLNKHALLLGSLGPLRVDISRVRAALARDEVAADLAGIAIYNPYDLLDCHVCDEESLRRLASGAPLNTDDRPLLEFSCALPVPGEGALPQVLAMVLAAHRPVAPAVVGWSDERRERGELERRFRATTHILRAQIAQLLGDPGLRARELRLALETNPGEVHVASCQDELAREIRDLRAALASRPGNTTLALRLADKHYVAGQFAEAADLYGRLAEARPGLSPVVFVRLAESLFRLGRVDAAERALRKCVARWPGFPDAHDRLAGILWRTGRLAEARRHISEALRLAPDDPRYRAHERRIAEAER